MEEIREEKAQPVEDKNAEALAATLKAKGLQDRNVAIVSAILAGENRKAVAAKHGVSLSRVHELLVAAGYKRPDTRNAERDAAIIADFQAGKKIASIAEETGLSARRIKLIVAAKDATPLPKAEQVEAKA